MARDSGLYSLFVLRFSLKSLCSPAALRQRNVEAELDGHRSRQ
jgi:hypothetical protein